MSVSQGIHWNPFEFQTAKQAWGNSDHNFPRRALGALNGAVCDVFLKNPYALTIGNVKQIFFTDSNKYTTAQKVAGCALILAGALYSILLLGAEVALSGKAVVGLGVGAGCAQLIRLGKAIQLVGEKILLTGAVPLFATVYALPKAIIESAPVAMRVIVRTIGTASRFVARITAQSLTYVCAKIAMVAQWAFIHLLSPLWRSVLQPLGVGIAKMLTSLKTLISKAACAITARVAQAAQWVFTWCLRPLFSKVLVPAWKQVLKASSFVIKTLGSAGRFLCKKVVDLARVTFTYLISPLWHSVLRPLGVGIVKAFSALKVVISKVACAIATKVIQAAQWVFTSWLRPLFSNVLVPAVEQLWKATNLGIKALGSAGRFLCQKVEDLASVTFTYLISPLWHSVLRPVGAGIATVVLHLTAIVSKAACFVATKTAQAYSWVFHKAVSPIFTKVVAPAALFVGKKVVYLSHGLSTATQYLLGKISIGAQATAHVFSQLLEKVATAAGHIIRIRIES